MWSRSASASVLALAAIALLPLATAKPYPVHIEGLQQQHNDSQIVKRQCAEANICGWERKLCCTAQQYCATDPSNGQAYCAAGAGGGQNQVSGTWQVYTSVWTETDLATRTSVYSSWVGAVPTLNANCGGTQSPCGGNCCDGGYYCYDPVQGTCRIIGGSSSPGIIGTLTPSAPLRPTASTLIVITATGTPTATVPFVAPIATGINGTLPEAQAQTGGLSGGAIAGIVIGVIAGILFLLFLCFYCCAKSAISGIAGILGFGKKKKHTHEETYIEEHHHHSSSAAGGGRRWYGQAGRPSRPPPPKKGGGFGNALGIGAALGGLALALGMKRRADRRHDDKSTVISGSSAYYSDYTSSSSASSSDRHTRPTRHSSRR